ncbi:MAG TPA: AroM family protein, partial [Candidatus Limnocylindrales bacterium]|nr:AroM family protein [Candidatus Limnocylindrales bacterium]
MPIRTVAAILIGQAPREDLVEELAALLPEDVELRQVGALDPVEPEQIPALAPDAAYPLTTQLEDTTPIIVDERWITPYLQSAVDRAHTEGAGLGVILCAAPFASVRSTMPLVRPFDVAREHVARLGARRLLVVVPADDQVEAARAKWASVGASVEMLVARLAEGIEPVVEAAAEAEVDAVVLDF